MPAPHPSPSGLHLAAFRALRYDKSLAGPLATLTSPPYDVIDDSALAGYEARSPYNVVRLILPRDPADHGQSRYEAAAKLLADWRAAGVLRLDEQPALYVYEARTGDPGSGRPTSGLLGALRLVPPEDGVVLPHENTMAGPVADRLALTEATQANLEPIYLVYDGGGFASAAVADACQQAPLAEATTEDGVTHRMWAVTDADVLAGIAGDLATRRAVVADGHHRYATYLRHQSDRHAVGDGHGPWDYGLTLLVDVAAFGPEVHAIHRVIPGLRAAAAADRAARGFAVREMPSGPGALGALVEAGKSGPAFLLSDGRGAAWLLHDARPEVLDAFVPTDHSAAWRSLDVTVAHAVLVRGLWGVADDEHTVEYRHDVAAAEAAAAQAGGTALLLNPTPVEDVVAVAAAGERMPRKSTLFTPKPRTGFVLRPFDDG